VISKCSLGVELGTATGCVIFTTYMKMLTTSLFGMNILLAATEADFPPMLELILAVGQCFYVALSYMPGFAPPTVAWKSADACATVVRQL